MIIVENGVMRKATLKEEIASAVKDCKTLRLELKMVKLLRAVSVFPTKKIR